MLEKVPLILAYGNFLRWFHMVWRPIYHGKSLDLKFEMVNFWHLSSAQPKIGPSVHPYPPLPMYGPEHTWASQKEYKGYPSRKIFVWHSPLSGRVLFCKIFPPWENFRPNPPPPPPLPLLLVLNMSTLPPYLATFGILASSVILSWSGCCRTIVFLPNVVQFLSTQSPRVIWWSTTNDRLRM